jgi:tRNA A-37 threonylcarbamoyl transferase component Bud32
MATISLELAPGAPDSPEARAAFERMPELLESGQILRRGRNVVAILESGAADLPARVVVKRFDRASGTRALRERLRGPRGRRAFEICCALAKAGVPTPRPLALIEAGGALHLVTEAVEGSRALRDVLDGLLGSPERRRPYLAAAGRAARAMHDAGWLHNDLTLGNFLMVGDERDPKALLIDLNRSRLVGSPSLRSRARDLARLRACECAPLRERPRAATCGFPEGCQRRWLWEAYAGEEARAGEAVFLSEVRRAKVLNWMELWLKGRWDAEIAYRTRKPAGK